MKPKIYPFNSVVGGDKYWAIIVITYDKCIFSANDKV